MKKTKKGHGLQNTISGIPESIAGISNCDDSPAKLELDVHLEEYRAIRSEIELHLNGQQQIINYELALLAALVAAIQYIFINSTFEIIDYLCFGGSILFSAFALIYFWHDTSVAFLAGYINHFLRVQIEAILFKDQQPKSMLAWDEFQGLNRYKAFPSIPVETAVSMGRYAITIVPSVGLLIAAFGTYQPSQRVTAVELTLMIFAIVAEFLVIISAIYAGWLFLARIPSKARSHWYFPQSLPLSNRKTQS